MINSFTKLVAAAVIGLLFSGAGAAAMGYAAVATDSRLRDAVSYDVRFTSTALVSTLIALFFLITNLRILSLIVSDDRTIGRKAVIATFAGFILPMILNSYWAIAVRLTDCTAGDYSWQCQYEAKSFFVLSLTAYLLASSVAFLSVLITRKK